jgi:hypothetical protein
VPPASGSRRAAALAPALLVALALSACGSAPTRPLSVYRIYPPSGFKPFGLSRYGIGFVVPSNWAALPDLVHRPVVAIIASGPAVISVSTYPRTAPPPSGTTELQQARAALVTAVKTRQPSFRLIMTQTTSVGSQPAVVLDGIESIDGERRHVYSTHVYLPTSEVVLEEYAPVKQFARIDREVFVRVSSSLRLLPRTAK